MSWINLRVLMRLVNVDIGMVAYRSKIDHPPLGLLDHLFCITYGKPCERVLCNG